MTRRDVTGAAPGPLIFLIAGEPSGDVLGGRLMAALKVQSEAEPRFVGVGGERMIAEGLDSLFAMAELSVMGYLEVVPKIPWLLARVRQTAAAARRLRPAVVVTIDSPDFTFRVARRVAGAGIPLVHYVAPQVWAHRPGRAARSRGRRSDRSRSSTHVGVTSTGSLPAAPIILDRRLGWLLHTVRLRAHSPAGAALNRL